jgi:hypothetical protein
MALEHGTCAQFDTLFGNKHGVAVSGEGIRTAIGNKYSSLYVSSFYGDCTAAAIYTSEMSLDRFEQLLPITIKYLGFQGRITAFLSRKSHKKNIEREIANLRKNNATGITVQKCNRNTSDEYFMITCVIKITNPAVKDTYYTMHPDMQNDFNTSEKQDKWFENDPCAVNEAFIEVNKSFGLHPFR